MINKNRIRLTESQLHNIIKESVKRLVKEGVGGMSEGDVQNALIKLLNKWNESNGQSTKHFIHIVRRFVDSFHIVNDDYNKDEEY